MSVPPISTAPPVLPFQHCASLPSAHPSISLSIFAPPISSPPLAGLGSASAFFQPMHTMVTAALLLSGVSYALFGHRKKFLDPNSISFSFLSKPVHTTQLISVSAFF
ncbi:Uncharacterized protein Fot_31858 [Forsythia ovata]|uniref:Uncharacterized protein n=1 Tax=Forsythia ovata TaxID=205694 RepID=A0ABD1T6E0_9LAMI